MTSAQVLHFSKMGENEQIEIRLRDESTFEIGELPYCFSGTPLHNGYIVDCQHIETGENLTMFVANISGEFICSSINFSCPTRSDENWIIAVSKYAVSALE